MSALINPALDTAAVPAANGDAAAFHRTLSGYAPTPVHQLDAIAFELGLAAVQVKDESNRLGLPAFKILGAAWAVERALREEPAVRTLVAASAGNHGRAVARAAALRGLACRIFLPERSLAVRRQAIAAEGADIVVVDGTYEDAVDAAAGAARDDATELIADVGEMGPPEWVIDGYATLFAEAANRAVYDLILVPVGVGSLAAAAARHGAQVGAQVIGVEPATAASLTASLAHGVPMAVPTPGTTMAGLDCAKVSPAAWPSLHRGIAGTVTINDEEADAAVHELAANGLTIGESGAAPLGGLRALQNDEDCRDLREHLVLDRRTRVLLIATEGATGTHAR
ncbi:MAG TPA: pyridoxal-phosphate dependent enzyme [Solirubrobacteraceae bacterium]|nr:pyridoxal-phosphate dependent enzyme [Solirubrobacteraceae bacterium]